MKPKSARFFSIRCRDKWTATEYKEEEGPDGEKIIREKKVQKTLTEEKILDALKKHKSIKQWAFIHHTRDVYTLEDEQGARDDGNENVHAGEPKPAHWHIVMRSDSGLDLEMVASWFDLTPDFIQVPHGGPRAFLDCIQCLTHGSKEERDKGKTVYGDSEVRSNFNWRVALDQQLGMKKILGYEPSTKKSMVRGYVAQAGKPLSWIEKNFPEEYNNDLATLKMLRRDYT